MIDLSRERGHPVYLQLKEQLQRRIASGLLAPGEGLPSVRSLAQQLQINPNTVVRAYRELELAGLVVTRHGEGSFVAERLPFRDPAVSLLAEHAKQFVRASIELGIGLDRAQAAVAVAYAEAQVVDAQAEEGSHEPPLSQRDVVTRISLP